MEYLRPPSSSRMVLPFPSTARDWRLSLVIVPTPDLIRLALPVSEQSLSRSLVSPPRSPPAGVAARSDRSDGSAGFHSRLLSFRGRSKHRGRGAELRV